MNSHKESESNFPNQIDTTSKKLDKLITQLNKPIPVVSDTCRQCRNLDAISWSQCEHRYCSACIKQLINVYLTLRNEIPKCPECNQLLDTQKISRECSYPDKYQIKITFKEYSNMHKLIHGYIRRGHYIIPNGLIILIVDFYHLNYLKLGVKCKTASYYYVENKIQPTSTRIVSCSSYPPFIDHMTLSEASKLNINDQIDHRDHVGRFLAATIIEKQGINLKIHYNSLSHKHDIWSNFSEELYRFAKYQSISSRPAHRFLSLAKESYIYVNPSGRSYGWRYAQIKVRDKKSGQVKVAYNCNDKKYKYWAHLDNKLEVTPFTTMCQNGPKSKEHYQCIQQNCDKYVLVLDFNKLCHKQKGCIKCNEFHPLEKIVFWPKCNHVLCIACLMKYAAEKLMLNTIPICPAIDCQNEIAQTEDEINGHLVTFLYQSWRQKYKYRLSLNVSDLCGRLKLLLHRKDRFKCSVCNKWHKTVDMFIDKNKNCEHKYILDTYECDYSLHASKCGHSDCLLCLSKCEICQTYDQNKCLIGWTKCGHKYHKHCARKYINEWLSQQQSILTKLSNQYVSNKNMIPLCIHGNCDELLDLHGAELLNCSRCQCSILYQLRKNSILINSRDINIPTDMNQWISTDINIGRNKR